MKKNKSYIVVFALIFVMYNIITFIIAGFSSHGAAFWLSYLFEVLAFAAIFAVCTFFDKKALGLTEIFFYNYPMIVWSSVYAIIETIISTVFMIIDDGTKIGIVLQILLFTAYVVIVFMCKSAKEAIKEIRETRAVETSNMKNMIMTANVIASFDLDADLKKSAISLAENFRFSDIVSNDMTYQLEEKLKYELDMLKESCIVDVEGSKELVKIINDHLKERNEICINYKKM